MVNGQTAPRPAALCAPLPPPGGEGQTDRELLGRFTRQQDGEAFAALVRRHGSMVLRVCRRVLGHAQDAEDAFQATFLALACKADSVGRPELLTNWLCRVASRTAKKARASALRRCHHERRAACVPRAGPPVDAAWQDFGAVLDDELSRLPDKYRAPLVLCYLGGQTNHEAARHLGWPPGSMSGRLARGRELLRERLEGRRRGGAPSAGMVAPMPAREAGAGTLPARQARGAVPAGRGADGGATAAAGPIFPRSTDWRRGPWGRCAGPKLQLAAAVP